VNLALQFVRNSSINIDFVNKLWHSTLEDRSLKESAMQSQIDNVTPLILETIRFMRLVRPTKQGHPGIGAAKLYSGIERTHCPLHDYMSAIQRLLADGTLICFAATFGRGPTGTKTHTVQMRAKETK
jgi:hypothetical protein